ncbi:hypothetical protein RHGRI_011328 [Rhododendron griersonianum]|uniref:Uncharacterized protein n=1 Tax=Rhododendron griersonianum TaxID=479676 RepID=A0AAV6KMI3_9ERIC|nr:hypothetical protein RHGRI_011328 [Rhododendron griersonianum]
MLCSYFSVDIVHVIMSYTLLGSFGLQLAGWLAGQVPVVRVCLSCSDGGLLLFYFRDSCKLYSS